MFSWRWFETLFCLLNLLCRSSSSTFSPNFILLENNNTNGIFYWHLLCHIFSFELSLSVPQRWSSARRPSSVTPGPTAAVTPSPVSLRWDAETPPPRLQRPSLALWFRAVRSASPPSTKSAQSRPTSSRTAAVSRQRETAGRSVGTENHLKSV